jgi:subtilase family serine protease
MTGRGGAKARHIVGAATVAMVLVAGPVTLAASAGSSASPPPWSNARVCPAAQYGYSACNAIVRVYAPGDHGNRGGGGGGGTPAGYSASQLRTAYSLTTAPTGHPVVAIVDAYGDSHAYSDLTTYRSTEGLPAIAQCTSNLTSKICFDQVTQTGSNSGLPRNNSGWDQEQSLDVDMVSAACPQCSILLVDSNTNSNANLATAENEAVTLGGVVVSNSYGGPEDTADAPAYSHAGVAIVVSSGDNGYLSGSSSPADYPTVVAAGGTSLSNISPRTESAWSGAGSYCSKAYALPAWQNGVISGCTTRAVSDVSSDADPNTGVAVYDQGWWVFGGTSVSSPFISGVIATDGHWASYGTSGASYIYSHGSGLYDVTSGSNGNCGTAVCNAGVGWDGPTGLGSVNGTAGL